MDGAEGIVPENDLWISTSNKSANKSMTEEVFNEVIDKVINVYEPIVTAQGGNLKVDRAWDDGTVNAYASRTGSNWNVFMFGGLARHEAITEDGFALVVCHEIGHHIGGAPKKTSFWFPSWATNEGQADYFATLKCLRKVFRSEDNKAIVAKLNVPSTVEASCSAQFTAEEERLLCQRGAMAGLSTAKLFQDLRGQTTTPDFTTPDTNIVSKTDHNHPDTQCRLDTYLAGALCEVADAIDVDNKDESAGVCYRALGDSTGVRPYCWFKPE